MKTKVFGTMSISQSAVSNTAEPASKRFSRRSFPPFLAGGLALGILVAIAVNSMNALPADDRKIVAALDTEYQAAVKKNDAATMDRILAEDFVLVTSSGM